LGANVCSSKIDIDNINDCNYDTIQRSQQQQAVQFPKHITNSENWTVDLINYDLEVVVMIIQSPSTMISSSCLNETNRQGQPPETTIAGTGTAPTTTANALSD
jgi:hypothetical protein